MTTTEPARSCPDAAAGGPRRGYPTVPAQLDLPATEHEILAFWRRSDTFAKSLARTAGGRPWTFYEGPPTANGTPGVHHVEARVFKDVFPRYQTMRGRHVARRAGWDCQGLHVEVEVEKELGVSGRREIEAYGVARFNAACRESVLRYIADFEQLTTRMGYWVDLSQAYQTMDAEYIDAVWWSLSRVYARGLLVEDFRITPYCPRCETGLSDHELGQPGVYETVVDPSVFVRLPLTSGPLAGTAALLVWTTTPWTLVSNTAVAVHPDVAYVAATDGTETLVVAEQLVEAVLGTGWRVVARFTGRDLERWTYAPPFDLVPIPAAHYVVLADYVTTDDGTGLVHQAPAFGADDFATARRYGLPVVEPVGPDGRFAADVPLVGGQFFKRADETLVADLARRELLFARQDYEHAYPHCWRCQTPLLYYALPAWYIRTTRIRDDLLAQNEATTWYPATVKTGRYGDWLRGNVDWSLSRTRFWGTPLPIWRCPAGHDTCVGSRAELGELAGRDLSGLDPHRPFVDQIGFPCPHRDEAAGTRCGQPTTRVPHVIDAWYDSGSMPFAQWGYPAVPGSAERFEPAYPAQFICEGIDQTRGWFYSLMAIGTLVFGRSSYETVVCVGLILAEDGRKMSKHLGNVLEPIPLMEEHGADALRWFMACSGSPWAARRIGHAVLAEIVRKVLLTYWNTVAFQALYAGLAGWAPGAADPPPGTRPVLDRWLVGETHRLVRDVTGALDDFDTARAGQLLGRFVDDLSNWYVRRSRHRFWDGDAAAFATLHETLSVLTRLLAPITPFLAERVWQVAVRPVDPAAAESVHLSDWPTADVAAVDERLHAQVALARRVVELGRSARAVAKVRTRQPLALALVGSPVWAELPADLVAEVAAELNVAAVQPLASRGPGLVEHVVKPNYRSLGARFGARTPAVAAAIRAAEPARLAGELAGAGSTVVDVGGEPVPLGPDDVTVSERPREGWSVVNEHGETVALDVTVTPELARAGIAREVVRAVQEARKASGLAVSDRIAWWWASPDREVAATLAAHGQRIAAEVLATSTTAGAPTGPDADLPAHTSDGVALTFWLRRA